MTGPARDGQAAPAAPRIPLSAPDITEAEISAVTSVLRTGRLSLGPELGAFESALAAYHAVPHAVAVSSGTAGLHLALLTLGIAEGDEVILPSFTFVAVANAVLHVRATPVFVDIDPVTLNLDPAAVERAITPRTRAILVVHTFGVPADLAALERIARSHSLERCSQRCSVRLQADRERPAEAGHSVDVNTALVLIEDACEAIGAEFDGRRVGSVGELAVFGFYPNKQLTTGEGGAVLARSHAHAVRLGVLRNQGRSPGGDWLDHAEAGYNYRLSDIACALGRVQLGRIDEILALRRAAAARYTQLLHDIPGLELPPLTLPRRVISWFVFVVRLPEHASRDGVQAALAARGIATGRYFPPIHLQPAWRERCAGGVSLPVTESIAGRCLALPFFNRITPGQQADVAAALRASLRMNV